MTDTDKVAQTKDAIQKFNKPDKIGIAGVALGTSAGVAGGSVAAGSLASAAGASTLLGSTALANVLGGVFVTATPVGWVVGCGIAGGLAGYGIAKMIKSGAKQDQIRKDLIKRLQGRLDAMQRQENQSSLKSLELALSDTMKRELISVEQAERLVRLVEEKKLKVEVALDRVRAINNARALGKSC